MTLTVFPAEMLPRPFSSRRAPACTVTLPVPNVELSATPMKVEPEYALGSMIVPPE
jgi:hypothetical protein